MIQSLVSHITTFSIPAAKLREDQFRQRNHTIIEQYNSKGNANELLLPLHIVMHVLIQGGDKRWVKIGLIVETLPYSQYHTKLDSSDRTTLQNRRSHIQPPQQINTDNQFVTYILTTAATNQINPTYQCRQGVWRVSAEIPLC